MKYKGFGTPPSKKQSLSWSEKYFSNLTSSEHKANNEWFETHSARLEENGKLFVPMLDKAFNNLGQEVQK